MSSSGRDLGAQDGGRRDRREPGRPSSPQRLGFLLVPQFTMIAFASAIEPLRLANRAAGAALYDWSLYSPDGRPVAASNGIEMPVAGSYDEARDLSAAIVCAGIDVQAFEHRDLIAALRRLATFGAAIGAVCTGSYVLAKAGLLAGYRSTIHWENRPGLIAQLPALDITEELFEIDRNRWTCAGGTAAADMMLSIIARDHGMEIAAEVTDQLIHHRIRDASQSQRMNLRSRLGVAHPKLLSVAARMEEMIETPASCAALAREAGISTRQLERLFAKYLNCSPTRYYLTLRLERARDLLRQTSQPVLEIALASGFISASHFSKSYREHYGHTPSEERRGLGPAGEEPGGLTRPRKSATPAE